MTPSQSISESSTRLTKQDVKRKREESLKEDQKCKLSERIGGSIQRKRMKMGEYIPEMKLTLMTRISALSSGQKLSIPQNFPGLNEDQQHLPLYQRISDKPMNSSKISPRIQNKSFSTYSQPQDVHLSHRENGSMLSNGSMSTLPKSLIQRIQPNLIQNVPMSLTMKSSSRFGSQNPLDPSNPPQIIPSPSICTSKPPLSFSPSEWESSSNIRHISAGSSTRPNRDTTPESSSSIRQSEIRWPCKETYASLIIPNSKNSKLPSSPLLGLVPIPPHPQLVAGGERIGEKELEEGMIPVINGIEEPVTSQRENAGIRIAATDGGAEVLTGNPSVRDKEALNESIARGQRFKRKGVWGPALSACSRTALWTENAPPMPRPPDSEFTNQSALRTIQSNPALFLVSTPIKVDVFESLLADHPNPLFVRSVCVGLREGFWPFADTHPNEWPEVFDVSDRPPKTDAEREFLQSQIDKEVGIGRFSQPFGPDLLPGMYSMPIHAVPKPGTNKHRLVTDHSAGKYALNSMISREDIAGVTLDNVQDLGNGLRVFRRNRPHAQLNLWKADVSEAYRHMPMHPLWQIKQVVSFQNRRYIDRQNVFGGRASQRIFHAFMSLVIWIAIFKLSIYFLYIYVDDSFSFEDKRELEWYAPYKKQFPSKLVKLLRLWDAIGLPHEERKQIFGLELPIIGFDVDPNAMRVQMSDESRLLLIQSIIDFAQRGSRRALRDFQRLAGHLNWALNVYPMLRPGLSALYAKTAGKLHSRAQLWINRDVVRELLWIADHLRTSNGVFFLKSVSWSYRQLPPSTFRAYTDASGSGLAYWFPDLHLGFQAELPRSAPTGTIFYFEALAVTSAILDASRCIPPDGRLAVFSDNLNTVSMFNSLAALPPYNRLLLLAVDALLRAQIDFRVFFVPGEENFVADALSRGRNDDAIAESPGLHISSFLPPRDTLGAGAT